MYGIYRQQIDMSQAEEQLTGIRVLRVTGLGNEKKKKNKANPFLT